MDRIYMKATNIALSKAPAREGPLLCKSRPIYGFSFYIFVEIIHS